MTIRKSIKPKSVRKIFKKGAVMQNTKNNIKIPRGGIRF